MREYQNKAWEDLVAQAERATTKLEIIAAFVGARKSYRMTDSEFFNAMKIVVATDSTVIKIDE